MILERFNPKWIKENAVNNTYRYLLMANGTCSFTCTCSSLNVYKIQKASFSSLVRKNTNSKTLLQKGVFLNSAVKRCVGTPKNPIENILSKKPPVPNTPHIPKTQQQSQPKLKPQPNFSGLKKDDYSTQSYLKNAQKHKDYAKQKMESNLQRPFQSSLFADNQMTKTIPSTTSTTLSTPAIPTIPTATPATIAITTINTDITKPVEVFVLKNNLNIDFETTITQDTKLEDIALNTLIEDAKKRSLIKTDDGKSSCFFEVEGGTSEEVGAAKNGIKLSPLGRAYKERYSENYPLVRYNFNHASEGIEDPCKKIKYTFFIAIPPGVSETCVIEDGLNKHLLVVEEKGIKGVEGYFSLGYLTSKKNSVFLSSTQFKPFQEGSTNNFGKTPKEQKFAPFKAAVRIQPEDLKKTLRGAEYLTLNLSEKSREILEHTWDKLKVNHYVDYNKDGITKKTLLVIVKDHDRAVANKGKHPLTADQIKAIEENNAKTKADNEAKVKAKAEKENILKQQSPHNENT